MKEFVKLVDVKKIYQSGDVVTKAVDGINFEIQEGEFVVIVGASGAGKTTVLKAIIEVYCILHPRNRIVLAAPTGKTSRCMTQSSGIIARMSSLSSISEAAAITMRTG